MAVLQWWQRHRPDSIAAPLADYADVRRIGSSSEKGSSLTPFARRLLLCVRLLALGLLWACKSSDLPECPSQTAIEKYKLSPGDWVRVNAAHINASCLAVPIDFQLDGEGYFAVPLLGEILAGGLTARQLETEIAIRLRGSYCFDYLVTHYFADPQISVEVITYQPFFILGEVADLGEYEYVSELTFIRAVSIAGGFTYRADQSDLVIERDQLECRAESNTPLLPGDILRVGDTLGAREQFF